MLTFLSAPNLMIKLLYYLHTWNCVVVWFEKAQTFSSTVFNYDRPIGIYDFCILNIAKHTAYTKPQYRYHDNNDILHLLIVFLYKKTN